MKKIIITVLLIFAMIDTSIAEFQIHRPKYLVDGQLIPYAIKLQTDFPVTNSILVTPSGKIDFNQKEIFFDSFILPIVSSKTNLILFGIGYMGDWITTNDEVGIDNFYNGTFANVFATGSLGDDWFWLTYQSVGLFSNKMFDKIEDNLKYYQFSKIGYKWSENFATSIGFMYASNFGEPKILELVTISYSTSTLVINAELPVKVELEYIFNEDLRLWSDVGFSTSAYFDKDKSIPFSLTENKFKIVLKYKLLDYTWIYAGVGTRLDDKLTWLK